MKKLTWIRLGVIAGLVAILEVLCRTNVISSYSLIPPSQMAVSMVTIITSGEFNHEILSTLGAIVIATAAAIVVGIAFAIVLHALPRVRRAVDPLLATYYSIPIFVFYPLFIVLFGLNDTPKVLVGFMSAVVTVVASTLNGLDRVPPVIRKTGRILKLTRKETIFELVLPAASPYMFNGGKLAVAHAFIGVLAAEFILSNGGLGYQIAYAFHNFDNQTMYGLMLLVLIIVSVVNAAISGWEKRIRHKRGLI